MGTQPSGLTATQGGSMRRQTSRASTVSSSPTRMDLSPSSPSRQVRTKRTQRSPVLGTPMPTTTSSTAWPRCVGMGLRGRSSDSRRNTLITYAATPTRTTLRCGARSSPSDSASAARSLSPTVRSALPMTGSRTALPAQQPTSSTSSTTLSYRTISHVIPIHHKFAIPQKARNFNVLISNSEGL